MKKIFSNFRIVVTLEKAERGMYSSDGYKDKGIIVMFCVLKYKTLIFERLGYFSLLFLIFIFTFLFKFEIFYNKKEKNRVSKSDLG